jgi:hypothetical protein
MIKNAEQYFFRGTSKSWGGLGVSTCILGWLGELERVIEEPLPFNVPTFAVDESKGSLRLEQDLRYCCCSSDIVNKTE